MKRTIARIRLLLTQSSKERERIGAKYLNQENKHSNKLERKIDRLSEDIAILFKYISSGLELHSRHPEREIIADYDKAPFDHFIRYDFASKYINDTDNVLDCACGVGYGSSFINDKCHPHFILGVDIDKSAIEFAKRIFKKRNMDYKCGDALDSSFFSKSEFDKIVSFETIEHVPIEATEKLISNYHSWLKKDGQVIASVPNQDDFPYDKEIVPFHFRHFTKKEIVDLFKKAGFENIAIYYSDWRVKTVDKKKKKDQDYQSIIVIATKGE